MKARRSETPERPRPEVSGTIFVLGKGGTGKSVLSAGLASRAARDYRSTLLVRIGESARDEATKSRTPEPSPHGFDVVDLDPRHAMDEYVHKVVRVKALVDRITGSEVYRKFFAAAPGLPELVLLGRIRAFAQERAHDQPRWAAIIVDCPSSGHGLLMLETPFAALRAVPVGPFANLARQIVEWLQAHSRLALVAIPEEMAVVEAVEFREDLAERTGLGIAFAFLNRLRQERLSEGAHQALTETAPDVGSLDRLLLDGARRVERRARLEAFHEKRLAKGLDLEPIGVPELPNCRPATVAAAMDEAFA